jgi:hypothetical protein
VNLSSMESSANSQRTRFNLITSSMHEKLVGEDEPQRLHALKSVEASLKSLPDMRVMLAHTNEFIVYVSRYLDDANYEIRLQALRVLCLFVDRLGPHVSQCYKQVCNAARQVLSQTHQSKAVKQTLMQMIILTVQYMPNSSLALECLLDKAKERSAKAREELLNIVIASVLKYPNDKFDSLRKIFFLVVPLMCDIKRNVRHAALECISVIHNKLKQTVIRN